MSDTNSPDSVPQKQPIRKMTRRHLLQYGGALAAVTFVGPVLSACGGDQGRRGQGGTPTTGPAAAPTNLTTAGGVTPTAAEAMGGATPPEGGAAPTVAATPGTTATGQSYNARTDVAGTITFWHFWGSPVRRTAIRRVIAGFEQTYPNIKVNEQFVPFGDIWTKNIAAVAAGRGMPDVIVEDRPQLRARAENNIDISLGELAQRDGITGDAFWPFTWQEATVDGVPYGLPYETDIRVLYYNKAAFRDAGLDPNKPPKDWNDLEAYSNKLDQRSGNKLERIGFFPTIGNIGLDQWGWMNGGQWQTENFEPTINAKENIETLAWMKKWTDRYGKKNIDAFTATFGQGPEDPFMSGKVAMKVDIQGYTSFLNFYNPKFTTKGGEELSGEEGYGVAAIPPAPGHKPASLSGGFALSIPRGSKNQEAAWEFIKYLTFVGQASWARDTYGMPTIEKLARTDPELKAQPNWEFFVDAMSYGRPAVYNPAYPSMLEVLGPAVDAVMLGRQTPEQALNEAQRKAEAEIRRQRR